MQPSIEIYGKKKVVRAWLKENYTRADARFKEIHPLFAEQDVRHGIEYLENPEMRGRDSKYSYHWYIPTHGNRGDHFWQTEHDIKKVLEELGTPDRIGIYHSLI